MCTKSRAQGVCDGRTAPNKEIGRFLSDTLAVVPRLGAEQFGALFNDSVQDVLLELQDAISTPEKFVNDVGITKELHKERTEFRRKAAACTVEFAGETP